MSGSMCLISPLARASISNGRDPEKKITHLKGKVSPGRCWLSCIRYVEISAAPWEKAMTPSKGPSSMMKVES